MSSCAASFSTCCPPALSASATSVSSPIAAAPPCCPSADIYFMSQRKIPPLPHCDLPVRNSHCGAAPSVAERCISSSASPPPDSCSALLHKPYQVCRMNRCPHQCPLRARRRLRENPARTPIHRVDRIPQNASHTHPPRHLLPSTPSLRRSPNPESSSCSTKDLLTPIQMT